MRPSRVTRLAVLFAVVAVAVTAAPSLARGPRPPNDEQASAVVIAALPFSATEDISRITRTALDPGPYCFNGGTVWYSFSSADRRIITASTMGSEVPAGLEIYRQTETGLQLVGCAYDFMTFPAAVQVEPGVTYFIMAGPTAATAERGTITVSVDTYGTPPPHDGKAGALEVEAGTTLDSNSTAGTNDSDDFGSCQSGGATMWHRFVPPSDGRFRASVNADGYSPVLNVGEQTANGIAPMGCVNASDVPTFFDVLGGHTYYLLVGNATGLQGGPYRLTVVAAPRIVPSVTIDDIGSVDRQTGAATISGTAACSEQAKLALGVIVTQREIRGSNFPSDPLDCDPVPVHWSVTVLPDVGAFGPGPADVLAGGTAFTQFDSGSAETTSRVSLRGR